MKYKKLSNKYKSILEQKIKRILYAGLDWCENTKKDESYWFSPANTYYPQAFGMLQTLEILGYGYLGAVNEDREDNLRYWFETLIDDVREQGKLLGPKDSYYKFIEYNIDFSK